MKKAQSVKIWSPIVPRHRRASRRVDSGSTPHQFSAPKDYFRSLYYQVCDLLLGELEKRFEQSRVIPSVLAPRKVINCCQWRVLRGAPLVHL